MKKVLIGCLGLLVVLGIATGIGAYFFVYKPASAYLKSVAQLQEIPKLNERVTNKTAFTAPADDLLTRAGVERFIAAQEAMHAQLGARMEALRTKYGSLEKLGASEGETPPIAEIVSTVKDLAGLVLEAKRVQVDALNAQAFSLAEYEWTRARVYEAAGIPVDGTFQQIVRDAAAGQMPDLKEAREALSTAAPEANRELVAPYGKQLLERAPLAFFGL